MSLSPSRFREAREAAGLTRTQLAVDIGVTEWTIANWEQGRSQPSLRVLDTAAAALGREPAEFIEPLDEVAKRLNERSGATGPIEDPAVLSRVAIVVRSAPGGDAA